MDTLITNTGMAILFILLIFITIIMGLWTIDIMLKLIFERIKEHNQWKEKNERYIKVHKQKVQKK